VCAKSKISLKKQGKSFRSFFSKIIHLGFKKNFLGTPSLWKTLDEKSIRKKNWKCTHDKRKLPSGVQSESGATAAHNEPRAEEEQEQRMWWVFRGTTVERRGTRRDEKHR
jgi:hypothetical protein